MSWRLPGYALETLLGAGATSEVWRARIAASGAPVALKRVELSDPDRLVSARREAAMLATLDHPNLIRIHRLVPARHHAVLVLDLADGGSLADLIVRRGRLTPGEVVSALAPIGAALAHAHAAGVVHGDVSAANILFTVPGAPRLADLGVARIVGDEVAARSTPAYVDPAVAAGSSPATSSDVFMLAAVAVHALTGRTLWQGAPAEMIEQATLVAHGRADLLELPAEIPTEIAQVLARALEIDPMRRCTAGEFALDLRHAARPVAIALTAGRIAGRGHEAARVRGARHALAGGAGERVPEHLREPGDPSDPKAGQLTDELLPVPRPRLPRRPRLPLPDRAVPAILATLVATLVVGVTSTVLRGPRPARPGPPTATSSVSAPADDLTADLVRLDEIRSRAFAEHDPMLLERVYASATLRADDRALLERLAPGTCRVVGVHTRYYDIVLIASSATATVVRATAELAPSRVVCAGRTVRVASGLGPTRLRIALVRRDGHRMIAAQSVSA